MFLIGICGLLLSSPAVGIVPKVDDTSFLAILAETHQMRMAGIKPIKMPTLPPGVKLPPGISIPGQVKRTLTVRLWSPTIAPDSATASLEVPSGLQLGDKLDLDLYRPTAEENASPTGAPSQGSAPQDFTIKVYWGSSATVQEGQPKIIKIGDLTPDQIKEMMRRAKQATPMRGGNTGESFFYKPNWTTGHWPGSGTGGDVQEGASLVGTYKLSSNYTGNVAIDVPSGVDFLPALDITSPDLSNKPSLDQALELKWGQVTNALGINASILGMEGQNTLVVWSCSKAYNNSLMANTDYMQMGDVKQSVADKVFLDGSETTVTVPAGIFANSDIVSMSMIAYGAGTALDKAQPLPRVQTKSTLQVILGGKKLKK